ncbi:MAG: alpha/beta hydrolase [Campylobacterales bacterium]|nr:alpha/beta hydrolase [Campylobacterales bacterium]
MAVKSIQYKQHTFDISYEIINPHEKVDLIVLHGWGSNKGLMKRSFEPYMSGFRHIYIDLPGFGNSTCSIALDSYDVARVIELFMIHINASKDIILGHSFGGKVALILDPKMLILVASAGIYIPKSLLVQLKIKATKVFNFFGLSKFRSLFVAEDAKALSKPMYETFKTVVNEDMSREFSEYKGKALLFWGDGDSATPLSSAEKIKRLVKDSILEIYEGDHYFFMQNAQNISQKIESTFLSSLEH